MEHNIVAHCSRYPDRKYQLQKQCNWPMGNKGEIDGAVAFFFPLPQRNQPAAQNRWRTCSKRGWSRWHLSAAIHAAAFPIIPRERGETFINFVTVRANGFRSSGRTLSITGTSPGANSISHSHRSRSTPPPKPLLSPLSALCYTILHLREPLHPLSLHAPTPSHCSLALFRKFSAVPRSGCVVRDYHMN